MKRFTKFAIFFTFLIFVASNINIANAKPIVAIDPSLTEVNVGEEFGVNIIITGEDIVNMAGWNGSLLFDPVILSFKGAMVGDFIIPNTDFLYNQPAPGKANMIEVGLSRSSGSGQGIIVVVNFIASKPGNTLIELSNFVFSDPDANEILVDVGDPVSITVAVFAVFVDIKPGSCPNPFNLKSKKLLPVAVLGTEGFDVTKIDPDTIQLSREGIEEGVPPIRWSYEDVATPFTGELCGCHDLNGDGLLDLTLKFKTQELVETLNLDDVAGDTIPLTLTGNLKEEYGGTPIRGQDCIRIKKKKQR